MAFNDVANRDGNEPVNSMWIEDKRKLCRTLDARSLWRDLACNKDLKIAQEDVFILSQKEAVYSPTEGLLHIMANKRTTMLNLFFYLKEANLLSAMEIVKKYVPVQYHVYLQPDPMIFDQSMTTNPVGLKPAVPPPLVEVDVCAAPQRLRLPQDHDSLSGDDTFGGSLPALNSTQRRAAYTIIATRNFDIKELQDATENFADKYLISKGAYAAIYEVNILNTKFAAKVYSMDYSSVLSDLQDTRLHNHENIVPITGKCFSGDHCIVLYELMTNGSLRALLDSAGVLNMDTRVDILRDAARGLQYLHSNKPPLLHRNIKSKNILLDNAYKAKLSDFGMAVHANKSDSVSSSQHYTHFSTRQDTSVLQRSKGYCAKEVHSGRFSEKTDTYAFGVVILEVCTGKPAHDPNKSIGDQELVNFVENHVSSTEDALQLADTSCRWAEQTYIDLFDLAQQCVAEKAKCRPTMNLVYQKLDDIANDRPTAVYDSDSITAHPHRTEVGDSSVDIVGDLRPLQQYHTDYAQSAPSAAAIGHAYVNHLPAGPGFLGQSLPAQLPDHAWPIRSQVSETNSSISDLDLSSIPGDQSSLPEPNGSLNASSTGVRDREVKQEPTEYIENPLSIQSIQSSDFSNLSSELAEQNLSEYLQMDTQPDHESSSDETESNELDPSLAEEVAKLCLSCVEPPDNE
ncbi:uncharacterized protein [Watersipora subatra]|uniref:uncharacterized protein n=1 Tax=Watersipora subatra TaxID=2589382 RepID=UPI00355C367E